MNKNAKHPKKGLCKGLSQQQVACEAPAHRHGTQCGLWFCRFISGILIGIAALPTRALAKFSASFDNAGPLAIAQQQLRDFLTAERASVSVNQ